MLGHLSGAHDDAAVPAVTHDVDAMHRRLRIGRRQCAGIRLHCTAGRQHDEGEQQKQKGGEVAGAASHDRLPQEAAALLAIDPKREWVVHFAAMGVPSA